eukprot:TRINITY_DN3629_c0_g1_i1.p1 TRINITY_DN3629_c0_g1~~TRINITY_DN3629_c0_g1_i1.p1  ORF type:complete len:250 (-),score=-1.35 TRINITY_DN3629_c0_g1_i1:102-851(-)
MAALLTDYKPPAAHSPEMFGRITALVRKNKKFILYVRVNEKKPKNYGNCTIQSVNLVCETKDGCRSELDPHLVETPIRSFQLRFGMDGEIPVTLRTTRSEISKTSKSVMLKSLIRIVFSNGPIQYSGDIPFQFEGMQQPSSETWTKLDCPPISSDFQSDDSGTSFGSSVAQTKLDCVPIDFNFQSDDSGLISPVDLSDLDFSLPPVGQDMNTLTRDQLRFRDPFHLECTRKLSLRVPFTNLIRPLLLSH